MRADRPRAAVAPARPLVSRSSACPPASTPTTWSGATASAPAIETAPCPTPNPCSRPSGSTSSDALPLASPEDKAGLKGRRPRAGRHDRATADIGALYRRDLRRPLLRLRLPAAPALPARPPPRPAGDNVISLCRSWQAARLRDSFDGNVSRRQQHQFRRPGAPRWRSVSSPRPDQLFRFDEDLLRLGEQAIDPRLGLVINALNMGEPANPLELAARIRREGLNRCPPGPNPDDLPFPFEHSQIAWRRGPHRSIHSPAPCCFMRGLPELRAKFAQANVFVSQAEQSDADVAGTGCVSEARLTEWDHLCCVEPGGGARMAVLYARAARPAA